MFDFISYKRAERYDKLSSFIIKPSHIICDIYDMWDKKMCRYIITGTPDNGKNNRFHGFIFTENGFKFQDIAFKNILNFEEIYKYYLEIGGDSNG